MTEESKKSIIQRVLIIVAGLAFLGTITIPMMGSLLNFSKPSSSTNQETNNSGVDNQQLKEIAAGYEAVIKREPNNINALERLTEVKMAMQDFQGAIEPVQKLMELAPESTQYLVVLLQLYQKTNNVTGALELKNKVEALVKSEPNNPQYIQLLAQLYQQTNDIDSTKQLTKKVEDLVQSNSENAQYMLLLAQLYQQTNNTTGSEELSKKVQTLVQSQPENPQYLQLLGQLQLQTKDLSGAIETLKKLQTIYPEDEKIKTAIQKLEEEVAKQNQISVPTLPNLSVPESPTTQP